VVAALAALVLGAGAGIAVSVSDLAATLIRWVEPVGLIWVGAIRMTVIPLVVSSLIVAVADTDARTMGRIGARAFGVFTLLLSLAAAMTALLAPMVFARLDVDASAAASLRESVGASAALPQLPSFSDWLVSLVPANPIAAAAQGAMLPLVVFTLAFGLALGRVPAERREPVVAPFRAVAAAVTILIGWILRATPLGVLSLAFVVAARIGTAVVGAVAFYVLAYSAFLIAATLLVYIAVALLSKTSVLRFARAVLPAQVVAVTTRSSMAALPAMVVAADRTLALPNTASSFGLPLAVSTFRLNQAVSWVVMALFAASLYGIELSSVTVFSLAITSVLMSFSVPGIPSASLFVVAPFYAAVGIPAEAIGVLIALDLLPDLFKTLLNVTGQLGAVAIASSAMPHDASTFQTTARAEN
jgi:proton glutamate symport protein